MKPPKEQLDRLLRGVEEVIQADELEKKIISIINS